MKIQQHSGFYVVGVSARTNNAHEISGTGKIGGTRAFQTDFEVYDQRATDPENAQIDVYVSLR